MIRKALGWLMLAIGLSGIVLSIVGIGATRRLVNSIGDSLQANMSLTIESLETVRETLLLTKRTVAQLEEGLGAAEETATNVAAALAETGPLLVEGSQVVTQDVPHSMETFQASLPALIEVSGAIDRTLRTLSAFSISRSILGIPFSFDLGVNYDPETPFDQSVRELGDSLEGMPERLRGLEATMATTNQNLQMVSEDLARLGSDLEVLNQNLDEVGPLVDEYLVIVTEIGDNTRQSRRLLDRQLAQTRWAVTLILVWFGFLQIAPIYLGWELIMARRPGGALAAEEEVLLQKQERRAGRTDGLSGGDDDGV